MLKTIFATATAVVALSGAFSAANAAVNVYYDQAAFTAATTGAITETFGTAPGSTYIGGPPYGPSFSNAQFSITPNTPWLFNNNASYTTYYYDWGSGNTLTFLPNGTVTINFTAPVTAFSVNLATFQAAGANSATYGYDVAVGTPSGEYNVSTFGRPTLAFFGMTSDTAITSFTLTGGANNFTIFDNVTVASKLATAPGVPEPATWAMMIGGLGLVGGAMRRRATAAKTVTA